MSTWAALPTGIKLIILSKFLQTIIDEAVIDRTSMSTYYMVQRGRPKLTTLRQAFPEISSYLLSSFERELVATQELKKSFWETMEKKYAANHSFLWQVNQSGYFRALWYRSRALQELVSLCLNVEGSER